MTVTVTRKFNGTAHELRDALREEFIKWREERCGPSAVVHGARAREFHAKGRRDMLEDVLDFLDELEVTDEVKERIKNARKEIEEGAR